MTIRGIGQDEAVWVDVDRLALQDAALRGKGETAENLYATPAGTQALIDAFHTWKGLKGSFGSYGENRKFLWRTTYLDSMKEPTHMGVDVNVPAGSIVEADTGCTVVWVGTDIPEPHGWGNRVIVKLDGRAVWMIYAHLADNNPRKVGERLVAGTIIGHVGAPHENGGWYPHVHVQAMTTEAWEMFQEDPKSIDGYCPADEWLKMQKLFPFPGKWVSFP